MACSLLRPARGLLAMLAVSLLWGTAAAQLPAIPGLGKIGPSGGAAANSPEIPNPDPTVAELHSKLAAERHQLELLESPGGLGAGAPADTDESELRARRLRVAVIVRTLEQHLSDPTRLAKDKVRLAALEKEMQGWTGFAEQPPYSILMVDRLRSEEQAAETTLGEADAARVAWDREQAQLLLRAAQVTAAATAAAKEALKTEAEIAKLDLAFTRRKLARAASKVQFSTADLEQVRGALAAEADKLSREVDRLSQEQSQRQAAVEAAQRSLEAAKADSAGGANETPAERTARLRPLERNLELQQAHLDAISARLDALRDVAEFNRALLTQWEARYVVSQRPDAGTRLTIRENAKKIRTYLTLQRKLLEENSKRAEAAVREVETRQEQASDPAELAFLSELKGIREERAAAVQRRRDALDENEFVARQVLAETGGADDRSMTERTAEWQVRISRYLAAAWDFELLAVEDSIVVDGKVIAGTRSVTVGKVLTALFMFVAGYALAVFCARQGERLLIRR